MAFKLVLTDKAVKDLDYLNREVSKKLLKKLAWIMEQRDPLSFGVKLTDPSVGDIRFRIGDYRAIGIVNYRSKKIVIVAIGHRREIYR
ncbi:MAG: type II toxin-antitoxin system RelE/ParE family toxin [Patescibacteria group bacterium]|jgi:mRNA interferase RelE/StbE